MSKAVGFLTGQASMAFEMLSTAWKALKKKIVAESFFFIMHGQLLPNLIDRNYFLSVIKNFIRYTNNSTQFDIKAACPVFIVSPMLLLLIRVYHARIHLLA